LLSTFRKSDGLIVLGCALVLAGVDYYQTWHVTFDDAVML